MGPFPYMSIEPETRRPAVGLIVLQADQTVEPELHRWLPSTHYDVLVSRVPSGADVTPDSLDAMKNHIGAAARLFPQAARFRAVAYCCTSGTSVIGAERVASLVTGDCDTATVTDPVTALIAACKKRGINRLALLSPYIESVSARLRETLAEQGIACPVFGSFDESEEARVAWIDGQSICAAAEALADRGETDGIFLSCTNLKTFNVLGDLEKRTGLPVMSSNFVLAEHLQDLCA